MVSEGKSFFSAAATVSPPMPESKTPIGFRLGSEGASVSIEVSARFEHQIPILGAKPSRESDGAKKSTRKR
jgi:hypothetical protein